MLVGTVLSASRRNRLQMVKWQTPLWEGPDYSWQVRLMLVALGATNGSEKE